MQENFQTRPYKQKQYFIDLSSDKKCARANTSIFDDSSFQSARFISFNHKLSLVFCLAMADQIANVRLY